jgi:hypothetical protein
MSFISSIISATVKTAMIPVAVVSDVVDLAAAEQPKATATTVTSAIDDLKEGFTKAIEGDII